MSACGRNKAWKAQRGSLLRRRVQQLDYFETFSPWLIKVSEGRGERNAELHQIIALESGKPR